MGVNIGDAQWAYTGFHRFRERLAREEGLDLNAMQGFGGDIPWDETTTPLRPFLDHSDCEDDISPEECAQVAPRLEEILLRWQAKGGDPLVSSLAYDVQNGFALVRSMRRSAERGEPLEFM
jgi:hypothetical protein